ncbi:MAG: class GN sortase [Pseudomonadota bacterium]
MTNWRLGLAVLALLAALSQFANAGLIYAKAWLAPVLIADAFSRSLASGERVKPWPWADTYPVARLQMARLGVERFIMDGDSGHAMAFGAGMAGGTRPGEPGMVMVGGHRDTHFRFLSEVQEGDDIALEYDGEEYLYKVFATVIADARSGFIPSLMPAQGLLMVTCYPFDEVIPGGSQRFVVVGERIWPKASPQ